MSTATLPEQNLLPIAEKDPDDGLITQAEYARMKGVTRVAINRHVKNGTITLFRGKIDPEVADQQLAENTATVGRGKRSTGGSMSFMEAKTKEKRYQAELAELSYKEKSGELIKAKVVEAAAFNKGRMLRDKLLNIPNRIDKKLAAETDAARCNKIVMDEIEIAINSIRNVNGNKIN